jgi:tetratricopeptide (TPR) repeat protein
MRWIALVLLAACSASAPLSELTTAEQRARDGDVEGALAAYRRGQTTCHTIKSARRSRAACASALLGEAEVLEHAARTQEAIAAYLAIPARVPDDAATASIASHRAGVLLRRAGVANRGWSAVWRCVNDGPDEGSASDALRLLLEDGRRRDARALADQIAHVLTALAQTGVADNLVWSLADLTEHELGNPAAARALYDRIPVEYPSSGLRDDARWHGARISRALGDPRGAVTRLRGLLATREVSFGGGSYFSIWLDDAQLELGVVLRDDLEDYAGAMAAVRRLPVDYPASILRDDALYGLAMTQLRAGDKRAACATRAQLAREAPDSKYLARTEELRCD